MESLAAAAAAAVCMAAVLALWPAWMAAVGGLAALLLAALWNAADLVRQQQRDIQRLRGSLLIAAADGSAFLDHAERLVSSSEFARLAGTLDSVLQTAEERRSLVEQRMAAVLGALPTGVVVVTASGLVSLVNTAARHLFPREALAPGTSVFAAITRDSLPESGRRPSACDAVVLRSLDGRAIPARIAGLADGSGWVLLLETGDGRADDAALEHDLALHEAPPPPSPLDRSTPLADLAAIVVDCETTGLDPLKDRIVSVGAVRTHGTRVFAHANLDMLINPGIAIPAPSTKVHGIDDAMVQAAPGIARGIERLLALGDGAAIVGHHIGFDLGFLAAEGARSATRWTDLPALDTGHLCAVLEPGLASYGLDAVCRHFGVAASGRHTALGDALSTAEVFTRMIPLLQDRGILTLGDALAHARRARRLRSEERSLGWHVPE